MQRSEINEIIASADYFIRSFGFLLPPFAYWSRQDFQEAGISAQAVIAARLGWDITDFGLGDFARKGIFLFTTRNGRIADLTRGKGMLYAEKIMISRREQVCIMHCHNIKTEDIINRGGGILALELYMSDHNGNIDRNRPVELLSDGLKTIVQPGDILRLNPGQSVTLEPRVWHAFWAEEKDVLVGEVSTVNDDITDNVFADQVGRFPKIIEDTAPTRLLVCDYDQLI